MAFSMFRKQPNMQEVLQATDILAKKTCLVGMHLHIKQKDSFLNESELTRVDAVIFATYMNQLIIASEAHSRKIAEQVIDRYVEFVCQILEADGGCFDGGIVPSTIRPMMKNRFAFYTQVIQSKSNITTGISAIVEEFEYIIKTDILERQYKDFSASSPLPILGFDKDFICQIEAQRFPAFVNELLDAPMKALVELIK